MIHIMATYDQGPNKHFLFKLTEPVDELEGELGEFQSDKAVRLGLKGNIFRVLGYTWAGGTIDSNGIHRLWYRNVERDRFKDGPLYYSLVVQPHPTKEGEWAIVSCHRRVPQLETDDGVLALPVKVGEV